MADNPPRNDKPPPPPSTPERSLKPTPEFQRKLDDFRAQKESKQDSGQVVDHRAAKAAREGGAQRNPEGNGPAPQQRGDPAHSSRPAEGDQAEPRQRAADGAGGGASQRAADVSRGKEGSAPKDSAGLRPTPEFQQKLDEFRAQKEARQDSGQVADTRADKAANQERNAAAREAKAQQRPAEVGKQQPVPEQAATRAAAAEQTSPCQTTGARDGTAAAGGGMDRNPPSPAGEYLDPAHDLRRQSTERDVPRVTTDDPPRPGDRGFDPGEHRGELRANFSPGTHDPAGLFSEKERSIADRLAEDGASVHPRERDDKMEGKKNPDSMVRTSPEDPGTVTEFKTLERASSNAVRDNILGAGKQVDQYGGGDAVLDGRGVNLTDADARRGYARAVGQAKQMDLPMPQRVMIIMGDGSIKVFPEE